MGNLISLNFSRAVSGPCRLYVKQLFVTKYLIVSLFHMRAAVPISTKFCTYLYTNSGKVLHTSMTLPTRPPNPGLPKTPKLLEITGEKTLLNKKCMKFFPGPGWLVI